MHGLKFEEANQDLVCFGGTFVVSNERYMFGFADRAWLKKENEQGEFILVVEGGQEVREKIVEILNKNSGANWTWKEFFLALSFFDEGYKVGFCDGQRWERKLKK